MTDSIEQADLEALRRRRVAFTEALAETGHLETLYQLAFQAPDAAPTVAHLPAKVFSEVMAVLHRFPEFLVGDIESHERGLSNFIFKGTVFVAKVAIPEGSWGCQSCGTIYPGVPVADDNLCRFCGGS